MKEVKSELIFTGAISKPYCNKKNQAQVLSDAYILLPSGQTLGIQLFICQSNINSHTVCIIYRVQLIFIYSK